MTKLELEYATIYYRLGIKKVLPARFLLNGKNLCRRETLLPVYKVPLFRFGPESWFERIITALRLPGL